MLNKDGVRELCYIVSIDTIEPITGSDNCEAAVVGGWKIMTRKNTFKVGDLAVYFEIDSKVPEKEPFIYDGTTYLPVRAVGEAVGKTVGWDGKTNTVTLSSTGNSGAITLPGNIYDDDYDDRYDDDKYDDDYDDIYDDDYDDRYDDDYDDRYDDDDDDDDDRYDD